MNDPMARGDEVLHRERLGLAGVHESIENPFGRLAVLGDRCRVLRSLAFDLEHGPDAADVAHGPAQARPPLAISDEQLEFQ
jgi:hypothetical protein